MLRRCQLPGEAWGTRANMAAMQYGDVHVESVVIEQACQADTDLYIHAQARTQLVGYINTVMECGCTPCVVVDVSHSEAIREKPEPKQRGLGDDARTWHCHCCLHPSYHQPGNQDAVHHF